MKRVFNLYNITLVILIAIISSLVFQTTDVKATGTVTWTDGSTVTISRTVQNVYNAPDVDFTYSVLTSDISLLKTADFETGWTVSGKIKTLASGVSREGDDTDTTVQAIKRANALPNGFTPSTANTVSTSGSDYPIYIFYDSTTHTVYYYSEADIIYLDSDSSSMFCGFRSLTDISGLSQLNTSKVINMESMFQNSNSLANIDALSNWDTSNVTVMSYMFADCDSLTNINGVSNWNTSSVTSIGGIFLAANMVSGTFPILGTPTDYDFAFYNAAIQSGSQLTINYGSGTSNIDAIIATKTNGSNVVKGSVVSAPAPAPAPSGIVTTATISFTGSETVSNNYTATKSTTINFANMGLVFDDAGIYEFTIKETATSNDAYPVDGDEYTVIIQVSNPGGTITGNYNAAFVINDSNDTKVNNAAFAHAKDESKFGHIELTKKVGGLMGGLNTYFDFSIQIDDAASNACSSYSGSEKYPVSGGDASHVTISEVTKCKSGTKDSLSLKHNQTAIIGQFTHNNNTYDSISIDDYYKIVEASVSDYTTTFKIGSGSSTSGRDTSSQSVSNGTNTVTYVNTREGSPLTGIVLTVLPFLILIGIGTGGLILFRKKKGFKKIKKEELEVI